MIMENNVKTSDCCKTTTTHISWSALIAGSLVGVGLGFLLNLFAMAIGLSAYSANTNGDAVIAIGGVVGLLIGVIASMGTAGFVAGYLGRFYHCYCHGGVIYGFITWSLALILSAILVLPMIHYVSFYEENLNPTGISVQLNTSAPSQPQQPQSKQLKPAVSAVIPPKNLAWSGWILFGLFFVGAFSSCMGACCGMRCQCGKVNNEESNL